MTTLLEMAQEVGAGEPKSLYGRTDYVVMTKFDLERFASLIRADERDSWPAEMEAMERQVNILTDALAQEREACAQLAEKLTWADNLGVASAIRARGVTHD